MKAAVYLSAGIGDGMMCAPLVRRLVAKGMETTILTSSNFGGAVVFQEYFSEVTVIDLRNNLSEHLLRLFRAYDYIFLDRASASWKNIGLAALMSRKLVVLRTTSISRFAWIRFIAMQENLHYMTQVCQLFEPEFVQADLDVISIPNITKRSKSDNQRKQINLVLQISAANALVEYKNWPMGHWIEFLKLCEMRYPQIKINILGDKDEEDLARTITQSGLSNVESQVGKTTLAEAYQCIATSDAYLGIDSGLMHVAVAMGKPTFTIWGPSDNEHLGYEGFEKGRHLDVLKEIGCRPCESLIRPNTSRFKRPQDCPDHACIKELDFLPVFNKFTAFVEKNLMNTI